MNKHPLIIDRMGLIGFTQNLIQTPSLSMQEEDAANLVAKKIIRKSIIVTFCSG